MTLAKTFARRFMKEYARHRWPAAKTGHYTWGVWTQEMEKILAKTAREMGLRKELGHVDFTWYRKNEPVPAIVAEHENGWKGVFDEEVPKLLASNAELKVLICYPPKKEHYRIGNRIYRLLRASQRTKQLNEEFLLIMGPPTIETHEPGAFTIYWCFQDYVIRRIR